MHADRKVPGYSRRLFGIARTYTGIKFQRKMALPERLPEYFMIISNHQSFIDIPFIFFHLAHLKPRFVAKEQLGKGLPLISFLFRVQRHALISRKGGSHRSMKELTRLAHMAEKGYCPVVFPEGTRSKDGRLLPFHGGAVRQILGTVKMPVLCIALDGGHCVSGLSSLLHNMGSTHYRIEALRLFPAPRDKRETLRILEDCRTLIEKKLAEWRN